MLHNSVHSAISFQNGTIRINLDELNCSKIELMKNKIVQTIEYSNGNGLNSVVLTLEQLKLLREDFLDYTEVDKNLKDTSITGYTSRTRLFIQWLEENKAAAVAGSCQGQALPAGLPAQGLYGHCAEVPSPCG